MAVTGDLLGNAISGLLSSQRALATVSHNISNVNTPGYSRQRAELVTRPASETGFGFIGNGVSVATVTRAFDQFIVDNLRINSTLDSQLSAFHDFALQVDQMLADADGGLSPAMQSFFNSVQAVADDPASIPARQVMLSQAQSFASRFHLMNDRLESLNDGVNLQINDSVSTINSLSSSIARLNQDIVNFSGGGTGQPPNDLLDQREELVRQLSEIVSVSTVVQNSGEMNIFIGSGVGLVVGNTAATLTTVNDDFGSGDTEVGLVTATGTTINITNDITGGTIGGVLDFKNNILDPAFNEIGRMAVVLAETFNNQHQLGQDLNGQIGGLFFNEMAVSVPLVSGNISNAGNALVAAEINDTSALTTDDYTLRFDGTNYTLVNQSTNQITNLPAFPGGAQVVDGVRFSISAGAMVSGDRFLIRPTHNGASAMGVQINRVEDIAAAAPVRSSAGFANTGDGSISQSVINGPAPVSVNLQATLTITFDTPPTTYSVIGVGTGNPAGVVYASGSDITFNGQTFQIDGSPQAGDTFTVESNVGGVSDNRNALQLAGLQSQLLVGGVADLQSSYSQFVSNVGTQANQAGINRAAQTVILNQSIEARESISGVNLDEEAANLMKFQQMYQAAAQVITVADTIFQTLIGAVMR